jgi:hypothetical protein
MTAHVGVQAQREERHDASFDDERELLARIRPIRSP